MALNLFYITNDPDIALIAEKYGVDRIWVDLETHGKEERQRGMNTVKSNHRIDDISSIKPLLTTSEMLVRVNPWNEKSEWEINSVIEAGADIVMLPMWKSVEEVQNFLSVVNGRAKSTLLLETKEAVECIDEVLKRDFDEIHIGLNDLHLSYGMTFMFELLTDGTVETLCNKFKKKGIPYGFGGIARLGSGILTSEKVIMEHYRLGSTRAILSRSFCDINSYQSVSEVEECFKQNMKTLREYEEFCMDVGSEVYDQNRVDVTSCVKQIVEAMKEKYNYGA